MLQKLRYPAEVRSIKDVPELDAAQKVDKKELGMATSLVEQMVTSFADIDTVDHYHEALRKLIEQKIKGKKVTEFEKGTEGRKASTTMVFVRMLAKMLKDKEIAVTPNNGSEFTTLKMPVFAPIPNARTRTATAVNPGFLRKRRRL